jgi:voltage-gated potassium channel
VLVPLALIFLVVLLLPLAVQLTPAEQTAFLVANIAIWVAFAVDYFARLYLAPVRRRFVRSHVLDLIVVVVPFLRPLRLLRIFGIIGEYVSRSRRHLAKRAMVFVAVVAVVAMLAGAAVIFNVEHSKSHANIRSFSDALWWAVGTITTVGTSAYPTTTTGRIVGAMMMVAGVALAGIFTAAIATYFISSTDGDHKTQPTDVETELPSVAHELAAMKVSIDRFHAELNHLRALLSEITERQRDHPQTNTEVAQSAEDATERRDGAVH